MKLNNIKVIQNNESLFVILFEAGLTFGSVDGILTFDLSTETHCRRILNFLFCYLLGCTRWSWSLSLCMKSSSVTIQMKATEQYFPVVLFIMLYNVILTFVFVDEILKCDHSNGSY